MESNLMVSCCVRSRFSEFRCGLVLCLALSCLQSSGVEAQGTSESSETFKPEKVFGRSASYTVLRNGKRIGEHTLRFTRSTADLTVDVESRLEVKYLGITVYKYTYLSKEFWQADKLLMVESSIKDHKKPLRKIVAKNESKLLRITDRGESRSAARVDFPSNHWHPGVLKEKRLFHTLHGKVYSIAPQSLGWEKTALANGAVVSARHYRYSGGFSADVWYDVEERWVKLQFKADDGSEITYSCNRCYPE